MKPPLPCLIKPPVPLTAPEKVVVPWLPPGYHWAFFAAINPAAWAFGAVSIAGAVALAWHGVIRHRIRIDAAPGARGILGWGLIGFALLVYPMLGLWAGHAYPATPTFGLPCPTTLFTVGVLLLTTGTPRAVYIAPLLWTIVGASAAFLLGVHQDLSLLVAGAAALWALWHPRAQPDALRPASS